MLKPHISFSELKDWNFCPYYHNQVHFQKVKGVETLKKELSRGQAHTKWDPADPYK